MKTKNKPHFLLMAAIVAVFAAFTVSCNKDDDPSLADLRNDKLEYLEDSLRISDSLRLIGNAGVVNYSITIVDGAVSSIYANDDSRADGGSRTKATQSALAGAIVTISQYGKTQSDTTDESGIAVFNGFFRSAVNISVRKENYTSVSYISAVNIQDSTRTGTISFVGNIIPVFPTTGANTATISGRAQIQTDLRNRTRELAPDGTKVTAYIDATSDSYFADKFLTSDIEDAYFISACGCQFVYVGNILQATYSTAAIGTITGGNYSITVPAAVDGLPITLAYSDVAADQTIYQQFGAIPGDRTVVYRNIFSATGGYTSFIPSGSEVEIEFIANDVDAQGDVYTSNTTGVLDRINVTDVGDGYAGTPLVEIVGDGTGAQATATVVNGRVSAITLTNAGTGYTSAPAVNIIAGSGATAATTSLSQDGTVVSVVVTNSGSGYTAAPTVTFSAPTGTGLGTNATATGTATIANGRVVSVAITNGGSGYIGNPTVIFSAPTTGTTATGNAFYSGESVRDVAVTFPGSNYTFAPRVTFSAPSVAGGVRATGTATFNAVTRQVTGITITNPGSGYTGTPSITLSAFTSAAGAESFLAGGAIINVDITNQGSGYLSAPAVVFTNGGGSGAAGTAVMSNGKVIAVNITNGGTGYTGTPDVEFVSGDGATAFATVVNGAITAINVTDGGRNWTGAPRVWIDSSVGGGATATATVTNGAITGVTMVTGGTGYLEGNTPGGFGAGQGFTATKGFGFETKPGVSYINDIYYGTGFRVLN